MKLPTRLSIFIFCIVSFLGFYSLPALAQYEVFTGRQIDDLFFEMEDTLDIAHCECSAYTPYNEHPDHLTGISAYIAKCVQEFGFNTKPICGFTSQGAESFYGCRNQRSVFKSSGEHLCDSQENSNKIKEAFNCTGASSECSRQTVVNNPWICVDNDADGWCWVEATRRSFSCSPGQNNAGVVGINYRPENFIERLLGRPGFVTPEDCAVFGASPTPAPSPMPTPSPIPENEPTTPENGAYVQGQCNWNSNVRYYPATLLSQCQDHDGDGWGWDGEASCLFMDDFPGSC